MTGPIFVFHVAFRGTRWWRFPGSTWMACLHREMQIAAKSCEQRSPDWHRQQSFHRPAVKNSNEISSPGIFATRSRWSEDHHFVRSSKVDARLPHSIWVVPPRSFAHLESKCRKSKIGLVQKSFFGSKPGKTTHNADECGSLSQLIPRVRNPERFEARPESRNITSSDP